MNNKSKCKTIIFLKRKLMRKSSWPQFNPTALLKHQKHDFFKNLITGFYQNWQFLLWERLIEYRDKLTTEENTFSISVEGECVKYLN